MVAAGRSRGILVIFGLAAAFSLAAPDAAEAQQKREKSRRSQRVVPMQEVEVAGPDGRVRFALLPNAERLTFTVKLGVAAVVEASPISMRLDGKASST